MIRRPKSLQDIAKASGPYPVEAYLFMRDGLEGAAHGIHGPMTPQHELVAKYMARESIDFAELSERFAAAKLDPAVAQAIRQAGGIERMNRNISGQDLCWALRDLALRRWGMLADLVLKTWNIERTDDFGQIVFALVQHGIMHKEPHDTLDDFKAVYPFASALRAD